MGRCIVIVRPSATARALPLRIADRTYAKGLGLHANAELMVALDGVHGGYGFARHKGYGTPQHQQALRELGTSPVHRLSYAPVAARLRPSEETYVEVEAALAACTTAEALRAGYRADAERKIRTMYAARAIAEAENITVRPEEVNAEYRRLSVQQDTPEADIRRVLAPETVAAALAAQKVQRFLLDNAVVTSVMDPDKE